MLKRMPVFLRVTESNGKFDALDQLTDSPRPEEKLYAYHLAAFRGNAFIDGCKCRGCYPISEFHLWPNQPSDAVMRDNVAWGQWCQSQSTTVLPSS